MTKWRARRDELARLGAQVDGAMLCDEVLAEVEALLNSEDEGLLVPFARRQGAKGAGPAAPARRHVSTGVSGRPTHHLCVAWHHRSPGSATARDRIHSRAREGQENQPGRAADARTHVGPIPA